MTRLQRPCDSAECNWVDYDGDGWTDIAVANDERPGDLFHNRGQGRFEQNGPASGTAYDAYGHVHAGMGIDWADYDRDGFLDLFITTFQNEEKNLYRNMGNGTFLDMGLRTGISRSIQPWISWGARFLDYDNDGWPDLLVASGHVQDQAKQVNPKTDYPQPLVLFHNQGGGTFLDVAAQAGAAFQAPLVGRSVCTGDIDNDGGMDAVVTNAEGRPLLLHNVAARGRWLTIRLHGRPPNTQAIGARITLETTAGRRIQDVTATGSFLAANDPRAHFGLGGTERVRDVVVRWPGGPSERFGQQGENQQVVLRQGSAARATAHPAP